MYESGLRCQAVCVAGLLTAALASKHTPTWGHMCTCVCALHTYVLVRLLQSAGPRDRVLNGKWNLFEKSIKIRMHGQSPQCIRRPWRRRISMDTWHFPVTLAYLASVTLPPPWYCVCHASKSLFLTTPSPLSLTGSVTRHSGHSSHKVWSTHRK